MSITALSAYKPAFFDPVIVSEKRTCWESVTNVAERYFHPCSGREIHLTSSLGSTYRVASSTITDSTKCGTALKVASYISVVVPLAMLCVKIVGRIGLAQTKIFIQDTSTGNCRIISEDDLTRSEPNTSSLTPTAKPQPDSPRPSSLATTDINVRKATEAPHSLNTQAPGVEEDDVTWFVVESPSK